MTSLSRTIAWIAAIVLTISALTASQASAQYAPPRDARPTQPRAAGPAQGGAAQGGPVEGRSGAKEAFRWSDDELKPGNNPQRVAQRKPGEAAVSQTPNLQRTAGPAGNVPVAIIPCPWEALAPQDQQFLDQLMAAWEQRSLQVERYRCKFKRWQYDPIHGPKKPTEAKTYGEGRLLYASPDKGLFEVQSLSVYVPPKELGGKAEYLKRPAEEIGEHWVCDGKSVFAFNALQKKLVESPLPPELQGKAIVDGPLPFLFGAKADKINARYWLRVVTPPDVKGEHWIEASPKYRADAANFKMVQVIIDEQDFLPKAMQLFDPTFDAKDRPIRTVYTFEQREKNWNITLQMLNLFHREFYEPKTPLGWTKVVESFIPEPGQPPPAAGKTPPTAQKPNPFKLPFKIR